MGRAVVWFRRDLSLDDNLAWCDATESHDDVRALYVLDRRLIERAGPFRREMLERSLSALERMLQRSGAELTVRRGDPAAEVVDFAQRVQADRLFWNADVTRYANARDHEVEQALGAIGTPVSTTWSTLVHPPGSVLTAAGSVPKVFTRFYERWQQLDVPPPVAHDEGDNDARRALDEFLTRVDSYADTRDALHPGATSQLSAYLRFGCISPRAVLRAVGLATPSRRAFVRQLAWRDWYAHLFDERADLVDHAMQAAYENIAWRNDPDEIDAWRAGNTGVPIVDAGMRQLAATGWMPNRMRMIAASFLVKDLLVDWRVGERHFRHLLVDGDVPQNAGNWQWVAGTGPDAAPYFRVFNPTAQAQRFDPGGDYVRAWVPELAAIGGSAIHAPWTLGPLELAAAGVTLGDTYPLPIVEHAAARARVLEAYAAARR